MVFTSNAQRDKHKAVTDFLLWAESHGIVLARRPEGRGTALHGIPHQPDEIATEWLRMSNA